MFAEVRSVIIGFMLIYLVVLLVLGVIASKHMKSLEDYLLAGRKIGPWVLAFTFSATGMSGWLALGFAGYTYESGFEGIWTMVPSATVGIFLSFLLVSKLIRRYSEKVNAITVPDVLEARYYDKSRILRIVSMVIILAAALAYVNGQMVASGKIFGALLGWDYTTTIIVAAIIFVGYTMLGGLLAVAWTDFIQGILMVSGSFLALVFALSYSGGIGAMSVELAQIPAVDPDFVLSPFQSLPVIILGISLFVGDGILSWVGQPTLMVRYMAITDAKRLNFTALLAVFIQSILFFGCFFAALYMRTQYPTPDLLPTSGDTETVLIQFFATMTHPVFAGIFIGGLLAAIMSTADSMLVVGTSTIINDVYGKLINPEASQKKLVFLGRICTLLIGIVAFIMSLNEGSVLWISWFGWTTLGLFFTPIVFGLWWKRATREGAIASLVSGFLVLLVWNPLGLGQYIFQAFAAGVVAIVAMVAVSLFTQKPPQEIQDAVEDMHAKKPETDAGETLNKAEDINKAKLKKLMVSVEPN